MDFYQSIISTKLNMYCYPYRPSQKSLLKMVLENDKKIK